MTIQSVYIKQDGCHYLAKKTGFNYGYPWESPILVVTSHKATVSITPTSQLFTAYTLSLFFPVKKNSIYFPVSDSPAILRKNPLHYSLHVMGAEATYLVWL